MSFDRTLLAMPAGAALALPEPSTDLRKPMIAGLTVIALAFGGFGTWAAFAPIDSAVVGQGVVTVESKRKTVQHREGGIVAAVLVEEGATVAAGTVLVRLDDATARGQLATLSAQHQARLAEQARLIAERDGTTPVFPAGLDPAAIRRQQDRFAERAQSLANQRDILGSRIAGLESQRRGRGDLEASKQQQIRLLEDEIGGLRQLNAKGYYPTNRLRAQERELARMKGEMLSDGAGASQTDKEIGETRLQILQLEQKVREDAVAELARIEAELGEVDQRLIAARDAVSRLDVVAPVAGVVQSLKVAGPGAVVPPGGEVAEIVPGADTLIVETQISPADIDRVHQGQAAELRFSAFGSRTTPVVSGTLAMVSADRFTDQATRQPYYTARIAVAEDQLARLPGALKAGMPVEVMLEGGERTPLQYLIKPLEDSFARSFKER
ncbi:MAG: HlyD family type I secretion periplasmic adaptor subunit [Magnetospirillum sp.]|nr:HlyD family type I secretion periplasmic adaptor subunit [Magnetospirillum sp.]